MQLSGSIQAGLGAIALTSRTIRHAARLVQKAPPPPPSVLFRPALLSHNPQHNGTHTALHGMHCHRRNACLVSLHAVRQKHYRPSTDRIAYTQTRAPTDVTTAATSPHATLTYKILTTHQLYLLTFVVWLSGNDDGGINEVNLRG